jgi:hypothetical protein
MSLGQARTLIASIQQRQVRVVYAPYRPYASVYRQTRRARAEASPGSLAVGIGDRRDLRVL